MKRLKYISKFMILVGSVTAPLRSYQMQADDIDVMVDFAYPVSMMQSVRQNLNQSLYFLQQKNYESGLVTLQDALSKLSMRILVNQDDREYIQAMIDQITALIAILDFEQDRSMIALLCQEIQDYIA